MYDQAPGTGFDSVILVMAAARTNKSMAEVSGFWTAAPSSAESAAILVDAALTSGLGMEKIRDM